MDLLNFSNEIFLQIFRSLSDVDLVNMARVCKRFKAIAKDTIAQKYNGDSAEKHYEIDLYTSESPNVNWLQREFLETFSGQILALHIFMEKQTNKNNLMKLVIEHCRLAKHVILKSKDGRFPVSKMMQSMPNVCSLTLISLQCANLYWTDQRFPQLGSLCLNQVHGINEEILKQFLCINSQLKHLQLVNCFHCSSNTLEQLGHHLKGLKSLEYRPIESAEIARDWRDINVANMECLKLSVHGSLTSEILGAIGRGGNMISNLEVTFRDGDIDAENTLSEFRDVISFFDKLTSLELVNFQVGLKLIEIFARKLPKLTKLHLSNVQFGEISAHNILEVFERCEHLEQLKLKNNGQRVSPGDQFNLEFHRKFFKIAQNHGKKIKLEMIQLDGNMLITEEKIVRNGIMLYWTGCEASHSRSDVHLFDVDDRILEKIYDYLDESAQRALYETCYKMKNAMQERIKSQWFTISDEATAKDLFNRFCEHITKLKIDMNTNNRQQMAETWKIISDNCSKQITEMSLNNVNVDATGSLAVQFPELSVLKVLSMISNTSHIFPLMQCAKLEKLEFDEGDIIFPDQITHFGISMDSLTIIRANHFNDSTHKLLSRLDQNRCYQIKEFTVERKDARPSKVVNISMRFRNLVTLNLICSTLEKTNVEYLFQSCSKLRKLSLQNVGDYELEKWQVIIQYIKEYCKHLELIQCVHCSYESNPYNHDYLKEIANSLPMVKVKEVVRTGNNFKITTFKPHKALGRQKLF